MKDRNTVHSPYMGRAIALSIENVTAGGGPFGAVIVQDGRVIAEGVNRVTPSNDPTAHAEIVAIREACRRLGSFRLDGCEIYASCEPCPMCMSAIYWARLNRIYYAGTRADASDAGFDDDLIYDELRAAPELRRIPATRLLHEEALAAFAAWKRKADKVAY
jgi:tRNA(Arg) A34 adenosine deaminase TadA